MALEPVFGVPQMGKILIPNAVISYPTGGKTVSKYTGVVAFTQSKLAGVEKGLYRPEEIDAHRDEIDPALLEPVLVQASITHNQRTVIGSRWQYFRMFGFGTLTATPAVATYLALGSTSSNWANASGHLGLNSNANTTGAELTTGYSYHRTTGANAGTTAATGLDALFTVSISTSWTATGDSTVQIVGIFDAANLSSSNLFAEATVSTATVANTDTVTLTWTINN